MGTYSERPYIVSLCFGTRIIVERIVGLFARELFVLSICTCGMIKQAIYVWFAHVERQGWIIIDAHMARQGVIYFVVAHAARQGGLYRDDL